MEFKLIIKKLNNTLTNVESELFDTWYNQSPKHKLYFNNVEKNYSKDIEFIDLEKGWKSLNKKLKPQKPKSNYWKHIAAAAIIVFFISISFLFKDSKINSEKNTQITNQSIAPGTNKATLTLEDGVVIELGKGEDFTSNHATSNGEKLIYKKQTETPKEIVYNYLTIPRKGEYHIVLSDGTQVWLNSESQLKYPVFFNNNTNRKVELVYGEAYFDVSPSSSHNGTKFIVTTKNQDVEVIGTEFNIKAYNDEDIISTTLVEGKINIEVNSSKEVLNPEQQFVLNKINNDFIITHVDTYSETAWRKGLFSFKNKSLKDIMKVLSRWYDIDVVFENKSLEHIEFKGVISKNQNIEDILTLIKDTNFINTYEINKKTIIIK
ncbi:FecR family protein [uncultured Algibacter sp.]|uniref:FecR family protein n=1 Tax=uncultured Algibacter sp. TaxID=298659 RepID=UPI0032179B03